MRIYTSIYRYIYREGERSIDVYPLLWSLGGGHAAESRRGPFLMDSNTQLSASSWPPVVGSCQSQLSAVASPSCQHGSCQRQSLKAGTLLPIARLAAGGLVIEPASELSGGRWQLQAASRQPLQQIATNVCTPPAGAPEAAAEQVCSARE